MDCSPPGSSLHGISRHEYWSGLPFSSPGGLPDPGIESRSPALQADSLPTELKGKPLISSLGIPLFDLNLSAKTEAVSLPLVLVLANLWRDHS